MGSRTFQHIMQTHGIQIASSVPYLMHTILAFSAAHLSHESPQDPKWRFASIAHYDHALSLWQLRLARLPSPEEHDLDARLAAIFLHAMLAILHSSAELKKGLKLEKWKPGWTWIPSVLGIQGLLHGPGVHLDELDQEVWATLLEQYLPGRPRQLCSGHDGSDIMAFSRERTVLADLERACMSEHTAPSVALVYRKALDLWHGLLASRPSQDDDSETIDVFLSAASHLTFEFADLLKSKDPRAVLLVGFWLVMFGKKCRGWWIAGSVTTKCIHASEFLRAQREYKVDENFAGVVEWMQEWIRSG